MKSIQALFAFEIRSASRLVSLFLTRGSVWSWSHSGLISAEWPYGAFCANFSSFGPPWHLGRGFNVDQKGEFNDSFLIFKTAVEEKKKPKVRVHFLDWFSVCVCLRVCRINCKANFFSQCLNSDTDWGSWEVIFPKPFLFLTRKKKTTFGLVLFLFVNSSLVFNVPPFWMDCLFFNLE